MTEARFPTFYIEKECCCLSFSHTHTYIHIHTHIHTHTYTHTHTNTNTHTHTHSPFCFTYNVGLRIHTMSRREHKTHRTVVKLCLQSLQNLSATNDAHLRNTYISLETKVANLKMGGGGKGNKKTCTLYREYKTAIYNLSENI